MPSANQPQADFWASPAGRAWIEHEGALDATTQGILAVLLDEAALTATDAVLDVGCGTGASTIAAARLVPSGTVLGLDIAGPMLERARQRVLDLGLANATFRLCDAQVEPLAAESFDTLISRFGMSFFDDSVAAFRNLAAALRDGGRMVFVSWGRLDQNPWLAVPQDLARRRLGAPPDPPASGPGPMAFADPDHVVDLMRQAGLSDARARTLPIDVTPPGGPSGAARLAIHVGPAARLLRLRNATPEGRAALAADIEAAFAPFAQGAECPIPSVVHVFSCRRQAQRQA